MASESGYNRMFPVSWTELHRDARALAWRLADYAGSQRRWAALS